MRAKILKATSARSLQEKLNSHLDIGWELEAGSYHVVETLHEMQWRGGDMHVRTLISREYTCMVKAYDGAIREPGE